jgi:dipeptidyl aminopeptidase/acylaminoacyl peptidase
MLRRQEQGLEGDDLLYVDPTGEWILLSYQRTVYDYPSVSRVTLADNKSQEVVAQRDDVWEWFADDDGVVRAGMGFTADKWSMVYRRTASEKFKKIGSAKYDDQDAALDILRFARESDDGFVLRNQETGRFGLYRYNFATKTVGEKVFDSPTNDVTDFDLTPDGKSVRAVWYTDDRDRIVWFDPELKKIQADIDGALKSSEAWIVSRTRDNASMLVWVGSVSNPGSYYFYRPESGMMQRLAKINEAVKSSELSPSRYIKYKARDGLEVAGYLTLPAGRDAKGLPLIVLPHGGPYGVRDSGDYDAEVQFLANRGYAVLQPNFRGSEAMAKPFTKRARANGAAPCKMIWMTAWIGWRKKARLTPNVLASSVHPMVAMRRYGARRVILNAIAVLQAMPV